MASRTALPGTESTGDVWTTTYIDRLPGGAIGYSKVTANQGSITTAVDLTSLTVTVTVNASRLILISAYGLFTNGTNGDGAAMTILEGATQLASSSGIGPSNAVGFALTPSALLVAPSTGSHTYKCQGVQQIGGTVTLNASSTAPAYILVQDLGPSF